MFFNCDHSRTWNSPWLVAASQSRSAAPRRGWGCLQDSRSSPPSPVYLAVPAACRSTTPANRRGNLRGRNTRAPPCLPRRNWTRRERSSSSWPGTALGWPPLLSQGSSQTASPAGLKRRPLAGTHCALGADVCAAVGRRVREARRWCSAARTRRGATTGSRRPGGLC